jgi:acylphosphatase
MQLFYSGYVQGVGFRYTVKSVASGFDVTGTVRNLPDGAVELVAEGAKDELEAFRRAIRESGMDHFIRKEDVVWAEAKNEFRGFEIVR